MKKSLRTLIISLLFLCLFASSFSALAMGFEAEVVYESVFVINTESAIGSGFAVGKNSIITNAHVIEDARSITVNTYNGESFPASVYAADYELDIALLVIEGADFVPLPKGDVTASKIGEDIYTIGSPKALSYTLTKGIISAKNREMDGYSYIQIDAAINTGNSGGPLLNDNGEVLGINTLKLSDSEGIGLAIPIDAAIAFLETCNITFDEKGNIPDTLTAPVIPYQPENSENSDFSDFENNIPDNPDTETPQAPIIIEENRTEIAVLVILFSISFLLNIGLITYITVKKRKNSTISEPVEITIDPSDRTDFEIEFME